ncbi:MAG: hypothetical protein JWN12_168 [Candidatus Saccharibacteria bacterium]|nr:hypothetical protein [Candidatus Saccharibacteria bacterium]
MDDNLDFDTFLESASDAERTQREAELYKVQLDARFQEAIERFDPQPRYTDADPVVQDDLQAAAAAELLGHLRETIDKPDHMSLEEFEDFLNIQAMSIVKKYAANEVVFTTRLLMDVAVYEYTSVSGIVDEEKHLASKKQLIADMIVLYEFDANDPWVTFVNQFSPGESFDPNSVEDQDYIFNSLQTLANRDEDDRRNSERQQALVRIIYPDFNNDTFDETLVDECIHALKLTTQLMATGILEHNVFEREARVVKLCAAFNMGQSAKEQILAFLQLHYPVKA